MDLAELAVSALEGPLLVAVEVTQPHVVDHHVIHQGVPVDADLDVDLLPVLRLGGLCLLRGQEVLLYQVQSVQLVV